MFLVDVSQLWNRPDPLFLPQIGANPVLINGKPTFGRVIFAHGAGAGMESPFMQDLAQSMAELGLEVIRFEFPYMQKTRQDGKRRPPDRMPKIIEAFEGVINAYAKDDIPLYVAGKSMGGRAASMLLDHPAIRAGFVFGFPFHPRGKPEKLRTEHLIDNKRPLLIFQGERDPMGSLLEVKEYNLPDSVQLHWLNDGDHDLKPRKSSGFSHEEHKATVVNVIKGFIE